MSKPELLDQMVKRITEKEDMTKIFRIKRSGKDTNDIFWNFGKIHGLENIAYCSDEDIDATGGNPYLLQKLVNKVTPDDITGYSSFQEVESATAGALDDYKKAVGDLPLYSSDRKKLLALPFYMAKRSDTPEPRRGQFEWDLFKELTGSNWNDDAMASVDEEHKITEFDYEKYLNPELLKNVDTSTD